MSKRRRPDGFTLVEILLAGSLLLVLVVLAAEVLLPMARGSRRASEQIHLQQLAQLSLERISNDLACAPLEGVTLVSLPGGGNALSVQRLADVTAQGDQLWKDSLSVYWLDPLTSRLCWREWPPAPPTVGSHPFVPDAPYQPSSSELQQVVGAGQGRVLTPNVTLWLVDLAAQPPSLRLRLESQGESFELTRRVTPRNHRF